MAKILNFKFPLGAGKTGFFQGNTTTLAMVAEDIKNLLTTPRGRRLIHGETMGTNIPALAGQLFENIDLNEVRIKISNEISTALEVWMPHVTLDNLEVQTSLENDELQDTQVLLVMEYSLLNAPDVKGSIQFRVG